MRISRLGLAVFGSCMLCPAQMTGRFTLDKPLFAPGEPVVLSFTTTNVGGVPQSVRSADPTSFCSGLSARVTGDPTSQSSCAPSGFAVSCLSGATTLPPGKSETERIVLNFDHNLTAAGEYDVDATKSLVTFAELNNLSSRQTTSEFRQTLHFRIVAGAVPPAAIVNKLRDQLASPDWKTRHEAARTLAAVAPPELAATLLLFPKQADFREFAPLALHNLHSPAGNAALAEMLLTNAGGTSEYLEAANFLAQSKDPAWFPLIAQVAQMNHNDFPYLQDAARIGEDRALPLLLQSTRGAVPPYQLRNVADALGYTGAKAAIPVLLDLLRSSDHDVLLAALFSLQRLTHLRTGNPPRFAFDDPSATRPLWVHWWAENGASARIYKADECGDYDRLR